MPKNSAAFPLEIESREAVFGLFNLWKPPPAMLEMTSCTSKAML